MTKEVRSLGNSEKNELEFEERRVLIEQLSRKVNSEEEISVLKV